MTTTRQGIWLGRALIALGFAVAVGLVVSALARNGGAPVDLSIYREALVRASHGSLYDYADADGNAFLYPPFAAVVFEPLRWFPLRVDAVVWSIGVVATAVLIASIVARWVAGFLPAARTRTGLVAVASVVFLILATSRPVLSTLALGQVTLLLGLMVLADFSGVVPPRWRGVLTGLAGAIKLTPLIFIPAFLATRQWRQAAVATGVWAAAGIVGLVAYPSDSLIYWSALVLDTSRAVDLGAGRNQSLMGALLRAGIQPPLLTPVWAALAAAVFALAMIRVRRHHAQGDLLQATVVAGVASVLISPLSWPHHQVWLVLAGVCLLASVSWWWRLGGALLVLTASQASPILSPVEPAGVLVWVWLLPTAAMVAIAAVGLPRSRPRRALTRA